MAPIEVPLANKRKNNSHENVIKKKKLNSKMGKTPNGMVKPNSELIPEAVPLDEGNALNAKDKLVKKRVKMDSFFVGQKTFESIINPISSKEFFKSYWEKKPLLVQRSSPKHYKDLLATQDLDEMFRNCSLQYGKNIDITSYVDGKRETHNPDGRVTPSVVWDLYNSGSSIRFLNPQTYHEQLWETLESLTEYFGSFCGANVYLTPPGTQGFAPHWDDIEAFVLQLEGKKRWRLYKPRNSEETLPRESSLNFGPDDVLGPPVLECVLEKGDLLYFPRGYIHQGNALPEWHSMHVTISTYQKTSWIDYMEKLLPLCLSKAANNVTLREGLPPGYLKHVGIINSEKQTSKRTLFLKKARDLFQNLLDDEDLLDSAADQMAKEVVHSSLPPCLTEAELARTVFDGGEFWHPGMSRVVNVVELKPDTHIKIVRRGCVRLVEEEGSIRLFYTLDNSREFRSDELKFLEVEPDMKSALEFLIQSYPSYVKVDELPIDDLESKMTFAMGLWEKGLITTKGPLLELHDE